jgi:serpin B
MRGDLMMSLLRGVLALLLGILVTLPCTLLGCAKAGPSVQQRQTNVQNPETNVTVDPHLVSATTDFAFRLFQQLAKQDGKENIFISPTSLELALATAYNGARGEMEKAMAKALGLEGVALDDVNRGNADLLKLLRAPDSGVRVEVANSLWVRQGETIDEGFAQKARDFYGAEARSINFDDGAAAAEAINQWVSDNTDKKISQVVEPSDLTATVVVIVNALYFNGTWSAPFKRGSTKRGTFTLLDGSRKKVPMMRQDGKFPYLETDRFQAISLPYGHGHVSMYIFLPKPGATLADFISSLTADNWKAWLGAFTEWEGEIALPRFKAECTKGLKETLTALGMGVAFASGEADLSGMVSPPDRSLFISDVLQKAVLDVNEEGTQAVATSPMLIERARHRPMTVDRPFFLAIRDERNGTLLFLGSIVDPQ